jgi:hypothetical protein
MGNKLSNESNENYRTPQKKTNKNKFTDFFSSNKNKSKSANKESLFSEERIFEKYDSIIIYFNSSIHRY